MFICIILIAFGFKTYMLLWVGYTFFAARLSKSNIAEFEACWWTGAYKAGSSVAT
jgi:hypothetical protein